MWSKGYFQARIGEPQVVGLGVKRTDFIPLITLPLPLISSKDDTLKIVIPITEGKAHSCFTNKRRVADDVICRLPFGFSWIQVF